MGADPWVLRENLARFPPTPTSQKSQGKDILLAVPLREKGSQLFPANYIPFMGRKHREQALLSGSTLGLPVELNWASSPPVPSRHQPLLPALLLWRL